MYVALVSVAIAAAYWGLNFLRHPQTRSYGLMVLGAAALAALGVWGQKLDEPPPWLGIAGAIGIGGAVCLLVVGPLVRGAARRFAATEQFAVAARLLDLAEILAPGSGVAEEKQLLAAMREIRDGHIEQTIDALTAAKDRAPAEAKLAIDERIAMLYLAAYRWDDAIAHAEANLFSAAPPAHAAADAGPRAGGLRRALGVAPPVWVELLGAYGYKGDLDQAARMLARLEAVCAGRDDAAIWVHRGRMMFLALAGRVAAVEALVAPRAARHMSRSSRTYWYAVALDRHGDGPAAHAAYEKARSQSRGRPRQLIERALERMPEARMIEVPPLASELVARVEAEAPPAVAVTAQPSGLWAIGALAASLVAWTIATAVFAGDSNDLGVLVRAGAIVPELVARGEWWRIVDAVFVHAGGLQLFVAIAALWLVGRPCEQLFGAARTLAIAGLAGLAGTATAYLALPISDGTAPLAFAGSTMVLGLLGAELVEIGLRRRRHRAWQRGTWSRLLIAAIAIAGSVLTDPAAGALGLAGALVAGALVGAVLSPAVAWTKSVAFALAGAFGAVAGTAAIATAHTSLAESFGEPTATYTVGAVAVRAPAGWTGGELLQGPVGVEMHFELADGADALAKKTDEVADTLHHAFEQIRIDPAAQKLVVPDGWQGTELVAVADADDGSRQTWRCAIVQKPLGGTRSLVATLIAPEGMVHASAELFTQILASATPR